jgi:DNA polymerase-3 subunit alpha
MSFTNLHAHTEASIADGLFGPKKWVEALKDRGFKAHAVTDHGTMTSLLPFYKLMKAEKMIPLMGAEVYYVDEPTVKTPENRKASHLILIAKNYDGFRNLNKLMKLSFTDGYYYKPRIGHQWLKEYGEGLVCLSACQGGVLSQEVWNEHHMRKGMGLENRFEMFSGLFGEDFYVEFQGHRTLTMNEISGKPFDSQKLINRRLYDLKTMKGFKGIVTNDCHYILPEHAMIQKLIKETSWKSGAKDGAGESATVTKDHFTDSLWLKKPVDIYKAFIDHHGYLPREFVTDSMKRTEEILEKCKDFELPTGKRYLPAFKTKHGMSSKEFFKRLTTKLLKEFLASDRLQVSRKAYIQRFANEFRVIATYGLEDYFLIVWDLIRFAKTKGIYTGVGRGSAAGCFISYLLEIVKIDPLEYGLIFERFLNENRCVSGELPDIDLDFESDRRSEIKKYIFDKYGRDHVCEIGTYGRMKLRTSLLDFGKALEVGDIKALHAITTNLDLDKEDNDDIEAAAAFDPRLEAMLAKSPDFEFCVKEIIGQIKSQGVHPAGVVISSEPIADITPVKTQTKKFKSDEIVDEEEKKNARVLVTQAEDKYIIAQGLMKMDILGLKEYDVIRYVLENVTAPYDGTDYVKKIIDLEREKPNKKVWKMFQAGKTEGVFQFASSGMKQLLIEMRPDRISDLIAANALFRPGCLENGWHTQYCKRKHGEEEVDYVHEDVEKALGETYGVIVYQEQFMEVIHRLGGISLVDSDTIRSALGKKDKEKLGKFKEQFVKGASERIGEHRSEELWEQIEKASGYTFNKSHSAAYSVLAYISQYLKVHYPAHFWAAQLDWDTRKNKLDDMLVNRRAASEMGVSFVLPHINRSKERFYVKGTDVIWSLSSVKGIGPKAAREIISKQPYKDFDDFHTRIHKGTVKVNVIQSLIYAGVFDSFGDRRDLLRDLSTRSKAKSAKFVSASEEDLIQLFAKSMGFFERKIKKVRPGFLSCISETELRDYHPGEYVKIGGMITEARQIKTKAGSPMGFLTVMDLDEIIEITCFPSVWADNREAFRVGNIVQIGGTKSSYNNKQNLIEAQDVEIK